MKLNTKIKLFLSLMLSCFGFFLLTMPVKAEAAFNPSYIIPDDQFIASSSMTENQIQEFLVVKGGSLATYVETKDSWIGPNSYQYPTGCPSENCINAKGMKASTIIYKVANWYGLNPQVILVTLQKEQSLMTLPLSLPDDQWRLNSAMGYGCPDSGGCSDAYKSFSLQTDWATWQLRWNMDKANSTDPIQRAKVSPYYIGNTITIDGVSTYLGNGATASLYRYTPHFHGNQNFYNIYIPWFNSFQFVKDNVSVSNYTVSNLAPARGEDVTFSFKIKNNLSSSLTLDAVGVIGRLGSLSGNNRDMGWQGPVSFDMGEEKTFTFTANIKDLDTIYTWSGFLYQGLYAEYNNWGRTLVSHNPNLSLSKSLTINPTTVYAGQNVTFSATLKNNEPNPIKYDAIGIPVKYYDRYGYDAVWMGPGTINAGGEIVMSGVRNIDKPGPYSYWTSYVLGGCYTTVGKASSLNALAINPNFTVSSISFSNNTPAKGETLTATFSIKNNLPVSITVSAVGIVGRYGDIYTGLNRDIGWQGPETFTSGQTKTFTFSRIITDVGNHYYWAGILFNGCYIQYNNWGRTLVSHNP